MTQASNLSALKLVAISHGPTVVVWPLWDCALDDKIEQTEIMSIESGSGVRIAYPSSWRVPQNRPCLNSLSGQSKDGLEGGNAAAPPEFHFQSPNRHEDFR